MVGFDSSYTSFNSPSSIEGIISNTFMNNNTTPSWGPMGRKVAQDRTRPKESISDNNDPELKQVFDSSPLSPDAVAYMSYEEPKEPLYPLD